MCDCGALRSRVRRVLGTNFFQPARAVPTSLSHNSDEHGIRIKYVGRSALLLKGPVSRLVYAIRPEVRQVIVDPRDSAAFLASSLFEEWIEE
jgi:hypothetical protein